MLKQALKSHQFSKIFSVKISDFIINTDDFEYQDPLEYGGESIVYLVLNKKTGHKHSCKTIYCGYSELHSIVSYISSCDSKYGIKYIGISREANERWLLHMEYVTNGSLSDLIKLDRIRKAPDFWFD